MSAPPPAPAVAWMLGEPPERDRPPGPPPPRPEPGGGWAPGAGRYTVLVVEDEQMVGEFLEKPITRPELLAAAQRVLGGG